MSYKVDVESLFRSKRCVVNEPRNVAVYLCRRLRQDRLAEIRDHFGMRKYSSVSSIIERMKARMKTEKRLKERVKKISDAILKSQEQT